MVRDVCTMVGTSIADTWRACCFWRVQVKGVDMHGERSSSDTASTTAKFPQQGWFLLRWVLVHSSFLGLMSLSGLLVWASSLVALPIVFHLFLRGVVRAPWWWGVVSWFGFVLGRLLGSLVWWVVPWPQILPAMGIGMTVGIAQLLLISRPYGLAVLWPILTTGACILCAGGVLAITRGYPLHYPLVVSLISGAVYGLITGPMLYHILTQRWSLEP
jgi:hypothetical protein